MTELIDAAISWPALLIALVIFGAAPNLVLRLLLLAYPKGHPQRAAIWADFRDVPRWERPFWVCEQLDGALFEGLRQRWNAKVKAGSGVSPQQVTITLRNGRRYITLIPARGPGLIATLAPQPKQPGEILEWRGNGLYICERHAEGWLYWRSLGDDIRKQRSRNCCDVIEIVFATISHDDHVRD